MTGRARRRHLLRVDRRRSLRRHRSRPLPRRARRHRHLGAAVSRARPQHLPEITPSGAGCRIWGLGERREATPQVRSGDRRQADRRRAVSAHQQSADHYRRNPRPAVRELAGIDKMLGWAVVWGERRKAAAAASAEQLGGGSSFNGSGSATASSRSSTSLAPDRRRGLTAATYFTPSSATTWAAAGTPSGSARTSSSTRTESAERYLREGRLAGEITRSAKKYGAAVLPLFGNAGWAPAGRRKRRSRQRRSRRLRQISSRQNVPAPQSSRSGRTILNSTRN